MMLGSWLWSAGADVGPPVALPDEDAHEEFAYLAADLGYDVSLDEEHPSPIDSFDDDDVHASVVSVKKPRRSVADQRTALSCHHRSSAQLRRLDESCRQEKSVAMKKMREVRQRKRCLRTARQAKMIERG